MKAAIYSRVSTLDAKNEGFPSNIITFEPVTREEALERMDKEGM